MLAQAHSGWVKWAERRRRAEGKLVVGLPELEFNTSEVKTKNTPGAYKQEGRGTGMPPANRQLKFTCVRTP